MSNRSKWWPWGRRKQNEGKAKVERIKEQREVEYKAKMEAEKSRDLWKERAEHALKQVKKLQHDSAQAARKRSADFEKRIKVLEAERDELKLRCDSSQREMRSRPKLFAQIEPSTAGRRRMPCFRFGIYENKNPGPDERPLCVSDYNGVPTETKAIQLLGTLSRGMISLPGPRPSKETSADTG